MGEQVMGFVVTVLMNMFMVVWAPLVMMIV